MGRFNFLIYFLIIPIVALSFVGCANTSFLQDFKHLRMNMNKGEVVDIAGNPSRREHIQDKDWWYYNNSEQGQNADRLVVFNEGKLIYAGRVVAVPTKTNPDKDDAKINATNEILDSEAERARVEAVPMTAPPSGVSSDFNQ